MDSLPRSFDLNCAPVTCHPKKAGEKRTQRNAARCADHVATPRPHPTTRPRDGRMLSRAVSKFQRFVFYFPLEEIIGAHDGGTWPRSRSRPGRWWTCGSRRSWRLDVPVTAMSLYELSAQRRVLPLQGASPTQARGETERFGRGGMKD
jgi:hypothetical protein